MNKKILSLILAVVMVISCIPAAAAAETGFVFGKAALPTSNGEGPLSLAAGGDYQEAKSGIVVSTPAVEEDSNEKIVNSSAGSFTSVAGVAPYADTDVVTFIVTLDMDPQLKAGFTTGEIAEKTNAVVSYEAKQTASLNNLKSSLTASFGKSKDFKIGFTYTIATTGVSVTTEYGNRDAIKAMPGVSRVYVAPMYSLPDDYSLVNDGALSPMTSNATTMIGADVLNESGYTGKGMRICILDTGLVVDHPSFQPLSEDQLGETSLTEQDVRDVWDSLNAAKTNLFFDAYRSTKIPYVFNYTTLSFDVSHATAGSDHGTHVAGIAAANKMDSTSVVGVAPEAQLIIMQVFGRGGAGWDTIMAAMEDAIRLNVDSVNLSLGSAAGFVDPEGDMLDIVNLYKDSDIELLIANGNDTNNALQNLTGLNMSKSSNPDVGLAGTPATYSAALAVASIDNDGAQQLYFTVNGTKIGFNDTAASSANLFLNVFQGSTLSFVCVPGLGEDADYEGLDVEGKVAVVSRGSISFMDKQTNAQAHGAVACVIYNNAPGMLSMQINSGSSYIPCVSITQASGKVMTDAGTGVMTVCNGDVQTFKMDAAVSDFSSWGVTSDLKLKPEIAGVGGNIYSSTDPSISGSNYGSMSGTSMATPQVTGAMAVLLQYLRANYPELTGSELRRVAANLAMSTANTIKYDGVEYSPRQQGAGLIDLVKATTSKAYLSNEDATEGRPKAEFGDDDEKSGVYSFSFEINNMSSDEALTYALDAAVLTETLYKMGNQKYIANESAVLDADVVFSGCTAALKYDFNDDGKITSADARVLLRHVNGTELLDKTNVHYAYTDVNGDGTANKADVETILSYCAELEVEIDLLAQIPGSGESTALTSVTVPAGESVKLDVTISLTDSDKAYMDEFENGIYVEGFLYLNAQDEDGVDLSMPFVGFYGDWSAAPIFDEPSETAASLYPRYVFTNYSQVGKNPYLRGGRSGDEYNAFSYDNPLAEMDFGMLRSAKKMTFAVTDKVTGEEYFTIEGTNLSKSYYYPSYGMVLPFYILAQEGEVWDGTDKDGKKLPDGTTVTYTVCGWLDDGDEEMDDSFSFDIALDDSAPQLLNAATLNDSLRFDDDGNVFLTLDLLDNRYIAAVIFMDPNGIILGRYEVNNEKNEVLHQEFEITGYGTDFTIIIGDYACNEFEYDAILDYGEHANDVAGLKPLDKNRIYGCDPAGNGDVDVGWFSAYKADISDLKNETYDTTTYYYAAEYVNGAVIAQSAITGDLVLVQPRGTYWATSTLVSQNGKKIGDPGVWVLYDLALQHNENGRDHLYATGWYYEGDSDGDGKDDGANYLFEVEIYDNGYIGVQRLGKVNGTGGVDLLTLGCTTEGQLYGIDTNAKLYTVDPYSGEVTYVATTEFVNVAGYNGANLIQSMGYDHNTGDMYWFATSQSVSGNRYVYAGGTYKVNLENGELTPVNDTLNLHGSTSLFIPNDLESDLFTLGVDPTGFELSPYETMMATGQTKRLTVNWRPWNCTPATLTWTSSDETVATVNDAGFVKAVGEGNVTITATGTVWNQYASWDENWNPIGAWEERTATCNVEVVPSAEKIYGFVISDFKYSGNNFSWVTYSDQTPNLITKLGGQTLPENHLNAELGDSTAMWYGGTYYQGYAYVIDYEAMFSDDGSYEVGTGLYRFSVTEGVTGADVTFGELEFIGFTADMLLGNMGFDYKTGRMYAVDYKYGGLAVVDIETGAVDPLGTFSGDIGGPAIAPAMCVIAEEDMADSLIIISDMHGKLYTVDPDTLNTTMIGSSPMEDTWYYAGMTYDYNTGNIYWNPCMSNGQSPLYLVRMGTNQWSGQMEAVIVDIGDVSSKSGTEETVLFTVPQNEPETHYIPVQSIRITNGNMTGLVGGTAQLKTVTTPTRPSVATKTWTSSDESVVTVNHVGKLSYVGAGEADITVSVTNRGDDSGVAFTDTIHVTVYESTGELKAFLAYDGGTGYYDYWLNLNDYSVEATTLRTRCINIYDLSVGVYYDNFYYAYNREGDFVRISALDETKYTTIAKDCWNDNANVRIVGMAVDFTTGILYGATWQGKLVTINMDNGAVTEIGTLGHKVYAMAADSNGTLYGVGSDSVSSDAGLYTINKTNGSVSKVMTIGGAHVFTDNYFADNYNSQMAYDFGTNRLYLHANVYTEHSRNDNSGLFMIQLGNAPFSVNLGTIGLDFQRGAAIKYGAVYLGLLATIPSDEQIPVGQVNGIILNKQFGRIPVGGTAEIVATVRPSNALDKSVVWTSSDESIATVDQNGVVTGLTEGVATITVTSNETGVSNSAVMTVVDVTGSSKVAYTVSALRDSLVRFNPDVPAQTAEIVAPLSGGGNMRGMAYHDGSLYYAVDSGFPDVYRVDLTTNLASYVGSIYTMNPLADISISSEQNRVYAIAGLYVLGYKLDTLVEGTNPSSNFFADPISWGEGEGIAAADDGVYYVVNCNGTHCLYKTDFDMKTGSNKIATINVDCIAGKTEMVYDFEAGVFYITDGNSTIFAMDKQGNTAPVDILGDGIDINGFAIVH